MEGPVKMGRPERCAFTLIELLMVVAIFSILAVVVVAAINPQEMLRRARDANRLSDLNTLNKAIALYQRDFSAASLGNASATDLSIPDPLATSTTGTDCTSLGLQFQGAGSLVGPLSLACPASSTYRKVDGTGWLPLAFSQIQSGSPIGALPRDPTSATSGGAYYYTYIGSGNVWKLTAMLESQKYASVMGNDGGSDLGQYEAGNGLSLGNYGRGLLVYWPFEENGTKIYDSSGFQNDSVDTSANGGDLHIGSPCVDGSCVWTRIVSSSYIYGQTGYAGLSEKDISLSGWVYIRSTNPTQEIMTGWGSRLFFHWNGSSFDLTFNFGNIAEAATTGLTQNTWYHVVGIRSGTTANLYVNGAKVDSENNNGVTTQVGLGGQFLPYVGQSGNNSYYSNITFDDIRVYSRALSDQEVQAIYLATKP